MLNSLVQLMQNIFTNDSAKIKMKLLKKRTSQSTRKSDKEMCWPSTIQCSNERIMKNVKGPRGDRIGDKITTRVCYLEEGALAPKTKTISNAFSNKVSKLLKTDLRLPKTKSLFDAFSIGNAWYRDIRLLEENSMARSVPNNTSHCLHKTIVRPILVPTLLKRRLTA